MSQSPNIPPSPPPPQSKPITRPPIKVRHALALWAISCKEKREDVQTVNLVIHRTNGTTKRKETYQTDRPVSYAGSRMVRLLDIWCRLRSFAGYSGVIQQYKTQLTAMAEFCECSINKIKPALKELKRMDWIDMDEYCIRVHSEKHIYSLCELNYDKKIDRIFYKPEKINDEKQTFYWLYVADIDDNRKRQAYMFHKDIMQTPEIKLWVYAELSARGYKPDKADKDPMFLSAQMSNVYRDSFHSKESEMHQYFVEHRPDVNRGVIGMAEAWNTCPQNVSYIKRQLVLQHLAFVQKIGTISSPGYSHNKHCHVMYNFATKVTFQAFCDDILPRQTFQPSELAKFKIAA